MAVCRSNMLIVLQVDLTHLSTSPSTLRSASNLTPSKLSRLSARQTHGWSVNSRCNVLTWSYML